MSDWRQTLDRLAAGTVAAVEGLVDRYEAGEIDLDMLTAAIAATVAAANSRALAVADLAVAADVSRSLSRPVAAVGVTPPTGMGVRLREAVSVITTDSGFDEKGRARLARLADNEPRERAAEGRQEAIQRSRHVRGWKRRSNGGCPACRELASRDVVLSPSRQMWRHTGCSCTQIPVTKEMP